MPPEAQMFSGLSHAQVLLLLAIVLAVVQFISRRWEKKDTKEIVSVISDQNDRMIKVFAEQNKSVMKTVNVGIKSFDPHVERTKLSHEWLYNIKEQVSQKDSAGSPLIYRNTHVDNTIEELVKLTHTIATSQLNIVELMKRTDTRTDKVLEKIGDHQAICTKQFNNLREVGK